MPDDKQRHEVTMKKVVYELPGMRDMLVERDLVYRVTDSGTLTMDLYRPPGPEQGGRKPVVVFVAGFPDRGFEAFAGCKLKEMAGYVSWGQLVAASGFVAVTYTCQSPVADLDALLLHLRHNAATLGIDEERLGICAFSGNVPTALPWLMQGARVHPKCAVLCYGPMFDLAGSSAIADAAARLGFAYPVAGGSAGDLWPVPLMVVRAGREEMPGLNASIDAFALAALARNLPLTLVNHAAGPHAFDLLDDSEGSREMVRRILAFLRFHLAS